MTGWSTRKAAFAFTLVTGLVGTSTHAQDVSSEQQAKTIFRRLAGAPLMPGDERVARLVAEIEAGRPLAAAAIATQDRNFYEVTLRNLAAPWSRVDQLPSAEFDDMQATFIGIVRDRLDARQLLTGKFLYQGGTFGAPAAAFENNDHYRYLEANSVDLAADLRQIDMSDRPEFSGVLSSRGFASAYLSGGTNRRAVQFAIQNFLCRPISSWRTVGLPEAFIRRDVSRTPNGNQSVYESECRTCHGGMDGLSGAFAHFDFDGVKPVYYGPYNIAPKYNINSQNYPDGFSPSDARWVNFLTTGHNASFGWRGELRGEGLESFASMLANSEAFGECMVSKAFKAVCRRSPEADDQGLVERMTTEFEANGYDLRGLLERLAIEPEC